MSWRSWSKSKENFTWYAPSVRTGFPQDEVLAIIGKQSRAFVAKTLQKGLKSLASSGGKLGLSYRPTHIEDPGGDFFIDFDD